MVARKKKTTTKGKGVRISPGWDSVVSALTSPAVEAVLKQFLDSKKKGGCSCQKKKK